MNTELNRRCATSKLLLFLGMAVAVFIWSQSIGAQELQEINIGSSGVSFSNISTHYAIDRGFFKKEGLAPTITIARTSAALAGLISGSIDYATFSTSAIDASLKGLPVILVAVIIKQPVMGLIVRKGITKISDLKGKTVGISSYGGLTHAAAVMVFKHYGLNPSKDVTLLATGRNAARIAAVKTGAIDAAFLSSPFDIKMAREGYKVLVDAGTVYKMPFGGITTTTTKLRENPTEVKKVLRAVLGATKAMVEPKNRDDVINFMVKFFKLKRSTADEFYSRIVPALNPTGIVGRNVIKLAIDRAIEKGITDKPVDPDKVVDFSLVKELGLK